MKENRMKPKRSQRHKGANWQGINISTDDKTTLSQAKPTLGVSSSAQIKPLAGKVFYLDLPSSRAAETLESDIKELGGTVEKFFSKEIKYLVTNKREARYVQYLRQDSPVPSPDSEQSSPHPCSNPRRPGSHADTIKSRSHGQTDTHVTSRGKSLVERVVKEQERVQMNKILSNALEWGVKILYIDDIIAYVQKRKKIVSSQCPTATTAKTSGKAESAAKQNFQKCKGGRIGKPFVKVEDSSRHYRPIYITMPNIPEFNLKAVPPCSPFLVDDKDCPGNRQQGHRGAKASATEERAHGRKKNRDKKRGGYCECCMVKYENLTMHLKSERHKGFSKSDKYLVVDRQVSTLHCNFIHIKTKVKRPKCSVSSALVAPGPCGRTELRSKEDLDTTGRTIEEQNQAVGVETFSRSALWTPREGDRRNLKCCSDRSKHTSHACKQLCRWNLSQSSCSQKSEKDQIHQPEMETAPSRGECLVPVPSRVTQVDCVHQISDKDMNSSTSLLHNVYTHKDSSKGIKVVTNQQERSDINEDLLSSAAAQIGKVLPDTMAGISPTENKKERPPSQNLSPVKQIRRKIKVYKRKRRKLDMHVEQVKPSDALDNSLLKIWELFQSSDDMDVEFHGFEA